MKSKEVLRPEIAELLRVMREILSELRKRPETITYPLPDVLKCPPMTVYYGCQEIGPTVSYGPLPYTITTTDGGEWKP